MPITQPKSDFDRYEDKQKDMDENHKTGKGIYINKEKSNGKKTKK